MIKRVDQREHSDAAEPQAEPLRAANEDGGAADAAVAATLDAAGRARPAVLVPVALQDFERRKRRTVWTGVIVAGLLLGGGAWLYKRSVDPIHAREAYDAGERLLRVARYEQAILSFDAAVGLKSDFAQAYSLRGQAKLALSKPEEAIPDFSRVIELRPDDPEGYLNRGDAYVGVEQYDKALADFERAASLDPELSEAQNRRGIALRRESDLEGALKAFNRAVEIAPTMNNYFERAATLQLLGRHEEAIDDLTKVIAFDPRNPQGYFARAKSYRALGDEASGARDHHMGRMLDAR